MTEKGTVVKVQENLVTLKFQQHEGCKTCGSAFCNVKERVFTARNTRGFHIREGDYVTVDLPTGRTIGAGFMALIMPLLLFIAFFMISSRVLHIDGDGKNALFGAAGMAIGFGVTYLIQKLKRGGDYPEIIEVSGGNCKRLNSSGHPSPIH